MFEQFTELLRKGLQGGGQSVVLLTDQDIQRLMEERKTLSTDPASALQRKSKRRGFLEKEITAGGTDGSEFLILVRETTFNPLDFSVILCYLPKETNTRFRLRRYNGRSHQHSNLIEKEQFYDLHIHYATQRYQELGCREDAYAQRTDRYSDLATALKCLLHDCAFDLPEEPQKALF